MRLWYCVRGEFVVVALRLDKFGSVTVYDRARGDSA